MGFEADAASPVAPQRGFMFGELLVAVLFLAIAISSVTALMYSVGRNPRNRAVDCTAQASAALPECSSSTKAKPAAGKAKNAARLLVAGCATRTESEVKECSDSVATARAGDGTTLRSRTDSASVRLVAKKPKATARPDLGFVR